MRKAISFFTSHHGLPPMKTFLLPLGRYTHQPTSSLAMAKKPSSFGASSTSATSSDIILAKSSKMNTTVIVILTSHGTREKEKEKERAKLRGIRHGAHHGPIKFINTTNPLMWVGVFFRIHAPNQQSALPGNFPFLPVALRSLLLLRVYCTASRCETGDRIGCRLI